jgi:hypothetical protein
MKASLHSNSIGYILMVCLELSFQWVCCILQWPAGVQDRRYMALVCQHMYFLFLKKMCTFDSTKHSLYQLLKTIPAGWQRTLVADYGVPLLVIIWTAMSYSLPSKIPSGIPRRLFTPLPWEPKSLQHWTVAKVIKHFIF